MKIYILRKMIVWAIDLFILLMLGGCLESTSEGGTPRDEVPVETVLPTRVSISTTLPVATDISGLFTATSTSTPTLSATATLTPTPLYSDTPKPTLLPEESQELLLSLIKTNGGCEFPCVWGISPGSDVETVHTFESKFGEFSIDTFEIASGWETTSSFIFFTVFQEPLETDFSFQHVGNPVEYILFNAVERLGRQDNLLTGMLGYYQLSNVLSIYGKPTEIWIGPWWDDPHLIDEFVPFGVVLYYPEKGFLAQYLFNRDKDEEFFIGCPDPVMQFYLTTWNPNQGKTFQDVARVQYGYVIRDGDESYKPILEAMNMTVDEFYSIYKHPKAQKCLQAPRENWDYGYAVTVTPKP